MGSDGLNETARQMEGLVRTGSVVGVDLAATPPRVRVRSGGLVSGWLPWVTVRAGTTRVWDPPTVGETGMLVCPGGETASGFFIPGLFTAEVQPPSRSPDEFVRDFPDGARIEYNHASGALAVTGIKTAVVQASDSVTVDCPKSHFTGDVLIDGTLTYTGGLTNAGAGSGATISGPVTQTGGALSSNGVVLHTHTHPGDSGGSTGGPR